MGISSLWVGVKGSKKFYLPLIICLHTVKWFKYCYITLTLLRQSFLTEIELICITIISTQLLLATLVEGDPKAPFSIATILDIGIMVRVFANGPEDLGSITGRVLPKTQKIALDSTLLNTQHYKVRIKGKVEQSRERNTALPYILV